MPTHPLEAAWANIFEFAMRTVDVASTRGQDGDYKMGFTVFEMAGVVRDEIAALEECPLELLQKMGDDVVSLERILNFHQYPADSP